MSTRTSVDIVIVAFIVVFLAFMIIRWMPEHGSRRRVFLVAVGAEVGLAPLWLAARMNDWSWHDEVGLLAVPVVLAIAIAASDRHAVK